MVHFSGVDFGTIGFGLMGFSWRPEPMPTPDTITAIKTAFFNGAVFWNGVTFYGTATDNSLHLLNAYFAEYPEHANKVVISIKGPPRGDKKSIQPTIEECLKVLDGKKHIDIFQCARVDSKIPIEETMRVLAQHVKIGKTGGIGLSEQTADVIRRANTVYKIACVEVESSLFALEITQNGVVETCAELGIPIIAYSPLGRGFLVSSPLAIFVRP
ncbi:putative Pyridoxal reductase [Seiridium cardinale]